MPKMIERRISAHEAMDLYLEEKELMMSTLPEDSERIKREIEECYALYNQDLMLMGMTECDIELDEDAAWAAYYWALKNELIDDQSTEEETREAIRAYFEELDAEDDSDENMGQIKDMSAADRRKRDARHKKRMRRNAINAMRNNAKRGEDDQMASSSRGGVIVKDPKSLTAKTEEVWKRAEKMKLVDDNTVVD